MPPDLPCAMRIGYGRDFPFHDGAAGGGGPSFGALPSIEGDGEVGPQGTPHTASPLDAALPGDACGAYVAGPRPAPTGAPHGMEDRRNDPEAAPNDAVGSDGSTSPERAAQRRDVLARLRAGDDSARRELFDLYYDELRRCAGRVSKGGGGGTLQPTMLVHEAFLRLAPDGGKEPLPFNDETHFLATAARAMRQFALDYARAKGSTKRTPPGQRIQLEHLDLAGEADEVDIESLDDALCTLAEFDAPMARAVELRVFGGVDAQWVARDLGLRLRTFQRRWADTMAWLQSRLATES